METNEPQTLPIVNIADAIVDRLARHGVRHVFGMPGSHSTTIYDAFDRHASIETFLIRNEQAGAFAADGYARVTGRPGIICTTAGPGATNALTGIAEAWADSVPVILLAGQVNADRMHQECGAYHEIPLESLLRPITQFTGTIRGSDDLPSIVDDAFEAMTSGRPRPAALLLPQDVARLPFLRSGENQPRLEPIKVNRDENAITRAIELLSAAKRPIVIAGGGALWSGAADAIRELCRRLDAPLVTTLNGKGIVDERDPISFGHARSTRAKLLLPEADAMLAIGCRFTEVMTGWHQMPVPPILVQIDLDADQIGMNYPVSVGIRADARGAVEALLGRMADRAESRSEWGAARARARDARPEEPEWLIETLRESLADETPVFADACEMGYRMQADYPSHGPRTFFYPSNYITLGWGFPAAIGAAVARGEGAPHVVSVSGDGGFVMTSQELATAKRYRLNLIAIVHDDSTYGAIKNLQKRNHQGRYRDVDLDNPDFLKLADSYDVPAARASNPDEFRRSIREAMGRKGPSLIEVPDNWRSIRR